MFLHGCLHICVCYAAPHLEELKMQMTASASLLNRLWITIRDRYMRRHGERVRPSRKGRDEGDCLSHPG